MPNWFLAVERWVCGREQFVLLPSLAGSRHLGADLQMPKGGRIGLTQSIRMPAVTSGFWNKKFKKFKKKAEKAW